VRRGNKHKRAPRYDAARDEPFGKADCDSQWLPDTKEKRETTGLVLQLKKGYGEKKKREGKKKGKLGEICSVSKPGWLGGISVHTRLNLRRRRHCRNECPMPNVWVQGYLHDM
jgi:hypothetical protein